MSIISAGGSVVGAGGAAGAYQISRSLRFNSADSAYLERTPGSTTNQSTMTLSAWVKRSALGSTQYLLGAVSPGNYQGSIYFNSDDTLYVQTTTGVGTYVDFTWYSASLYRDVSAWYHIVVAIDTTQATSTNRVKVYVNGVQVTANGSSTYPAQNGILPFNQASQEMEIGSRGGSYFNGYLTEIHFIDGQALDETDFGEFNTDTGVWGPIAYTGSYGTNGFYLNFSDNSTIDALGTDFSGNGNTWDDNGFSVTAGAGNDSLVDTCTLFGTDTGIGGEVRGNYATANPLDAASGFTFTNGNLDYTNTSDNQHFRCTFAMPNSGKYYWEVTITASPSNHGIALIKMNSSLTQGAFASADFRGYTNNGNKYSGAGSAAYGNSFTTSDVIGVAVDMGSGKIWFSKNGTFQASGDPAAGTNEAFSDLVSSGIIWMPGINTFAATPNSGVLNFGQRAFEYTAPSGFKALVTTNLPDPTVIEGDEYFNTVLYTGTGSTRTVTGVGFQPDWVWIKDRTSTAGHALHDVVRTSPFRLASSSTNAESDESASFTGFASDGFSLAGNDTTYNNNTPRTYVAWNWKANGAGVSNTDGTITSTVSVSTDSGFSIVTYTGTGANATVGHGLGVAPSMVIVKNRAINSDWLVQSSSLTSYAFALVLSGTNAQTSAANWWNNTAPTSTTFSIGDGSVAVSGNGNSHVAYCFAAIPGYSDFGSYTGNGSADGPFVFTGFRPALVLVKSSSGVDSWIIVDSKRDPQNIDTQKRLFPESASAESAAQCFDFLSNGFKARRSVIPNVSGQTYIYMAFAENPFKIALAR